MDTLSTLNAIKAVQAGLNSAAPNANQTVMLFNADGTPAGKYPAQQLIQDMGKAGSGNGVCTTEATTLAKVVSISDFILIKGGIISVLFTTGINVAGATLNVNNTGAKAIYVPTGGGGHGTSDYGAPIQPGLVRPNMVVTMQYNGTRWNVIALMGLEQSQKDTDLLVDLALPSGLLWATRNIDLSQANGFAASPYQYECSFVSWGNTIMHNPSSTSAFDYNWGTANDGPYADTPGSKLTANMAPSQDAARVNLGAPWRMPTTNEFAELFNNIIYLDANGDEIASTTADKRVSYNGVMGLRLKSKNNANEIFFPCSGNGYGQSWLNRGSHGFYWSSSLLSATGGRNLVFGSGGVYPQDYNYFRFYGFAVRPVQ